MKYKKGQTVENVVNNKQYEVTGAKGGFYILNNGRELMISEKGMANFRVITPEPKKAERKKYGTAKNKLQNS